MKKCTKCELDKATTEFHKDSRRFDGLNIYCKSCRSQYKQNTERKKRWYQENSEQVRQRVTANRQQKIDYYRQQRRDDYRKKTDAYKAAAKALRAKQLEKDPESFRRKEAKRRKEWKKGAGRHIVAWRTVLKRTLVRMGEEKTDSTRKMLGYTAQELRLHLEKLWTPQMSWANYGEWHIDHIKDLASFPKGTPQSVVNALSNLRPLWATTRIIDGVTYEGNLNRNKWRMNEQHHGS